MSSKVGPKGSKIYKLVVCTLFFMLTFIRQIMELFMEYYFQNFDLEGCSMITANSYHALSF